MLKTKLISINNGEYYGLLKRGVESSQLACFRDVVNFRRLDTLCGIGGVDDLNNKLSLMCAPIVEDLIHLIVEAGVKRANNLKITFTSIRNNEYGISKHQHTVTMSFVVDENGDIEISDIRSNTLPQDVILITRIERLNAIISDSLITEDVESSKLKKLYNELLEDLETIEKYKIAYRDLEMEKIIATNPLMKDARFNRIELDAELVPNIKEKYKNDIFVHLRPIVDGNDYVKSIRVQKSTKSMEDQPFFDDLYQGLTKETIGEIGYVISDVIEIHPRKFNEYSELCDRETARLWIISPVYITAISINKYDGKKIQTIDYFDISKVIYNTTLYVKTPEIAVDVKDKLIETDEETTIKVDLLSEEEDILHITLSKNHKFAEDKDECGVCDILK